jgi:hypothetical protein
MFTYDGFKRVNCSLQGSKVVVNGESYEITSRNDITSKKYELRVAILLAFVAIALGGEGLREFIGGDRIGSLFLLLPSLLIFPVAVYFMRLALITKGCRSQWLINFYHTLYVERLDDPGIENDLTSLSVPKGTPSYKMIITKRDKVVLAILFILSWVCYRLSTPYWAEIALLFPGYAAYLRIQDIRHDFRNKKWQIDTLRRPIG